MLLHVFWNCLCYVSYLRYQYLFATSKLKKLRSSLYLNFLYLMHPSEHVNPLRWRWLVQRKKPLMYKWTTTKMCDIRNLFLQLMVDTFREKTCAWVKSIWYQKQKVLLARKIKIEATKSSFFYFVCTQNNSLMNYGWIIDHIINPI